MKSQTISVAAIDIEAGTVEVDPLLHITSNIQGYDINKYAYPKGIQIINTTGAALEYLILSNADEVAEYTANIATPGIYPYYSFISLPNNSSFTSTNLFVCYKLYIKKVSGTASSALRIDLFQYV
jgi:hypothetical protein